MLNRTVVIDYTDANGDPSRRTVDLKELAGDRFKAWCHSAMAIRTFRYDRVSAVCDEQGEPLDRDRWVADSAGASVPLKPAVVRPRRSKDPRITVLFTGFKKAQLVCLESLAEQHDLKVSKARQVTEGLDYLVVGDTPGAKKIAKAESLGIPIMSTGQLLHFLETGEVSGS